MNELGMTANQQMAHSAQLGPSIPKAVVTA